MCVVSMVFDSYTDRFAPYVAPSTTTTFTFPVDGSAAAIAELRQLIADFKGAVAAARKVDTLTGQPDCEDPAKAKLEARVAALEKSLRRRRKPRKKAG